MARHVITVQTSLTPEEAFDYMSDMRNFIDWDPGVSSAEMVGDGDIEKGSSFDLRASGADLRYVLVEFDRPNRVVAEANTSRLRSYDIIEVEAVDGGSKVSYDATIELKGIFKIFSPAMALLFDRIVAKAEAGLRKALPDAVKAS
jgi:carbon monoxide dehydrogenase subunit G